MASKTSPHKLRTLQRKSRRVCRTLTYLLFSYLFPFLPFLLLLKIGCVKNVGREARSASLGSCWKCGNVKVLPVANVANSQLVLGIGYWQQFHIGNILPRRQAMSWGGGTSAMRGRATGRLCVVIRGVVSDAVSCLHNGVICDLSFKVIRSPMEDCWHYSTSPVICQSSHAAFSAHGGGYPLDHRLDRRVERLAEASMGPHGRSLGCAINKQAKNGTFRQRIFSRIHATAK